MARKVLKEGALFFVLCSVEKAKHSWQHQGAPILQSSRKWYSHYLNLFYSLVLSPLVLKVCLPQINMAKAYVGISIKVDNSQNMGTLEFLKQRGKSQTLASCLPECWLDSMNDAVREEIFDAIVGP